MEENKSIDPCNYKCPKCGSKYIERRYHPANSIINYEYSGEIIENDYISCSSSELFIKKELIFNGCEICKYYWILDIRKTE